MARSASIQLCTCAEIVLLGKGNCIGDCICRQGGMYWGLHWQARGNVLEIVLADKGKCTGDCIGRQRGNVPAIVLAGKGEMYWNKP